MPKAGNQTRQIFHLSHNFGEEEHQKSVNYHTPKDLCSVKYRDLDHAVEHCLRLMKEFPNCRDLWLSLSDLKSAFRIVPTRPEGWYLTIMMAENPQTNEKMFLIDKNLPFGSSISCSHFQRFSNCLAHLLMYALDMRRTPAITNYLDDFLFIAETEVRCNYILRTFISLCSVLGVPVAQEKTVEASTQIVFLGILIDGHNKVLGISWEKRSKALHLINSFLDKKKATVKQIQSLSGTLNFLNKAIFPGRAFTRRMYSKLSGKLTSLKQHHHVNLDGEFRQDCLVWQKFLQEGEFYSTCCRPLVDLNKKLLAKDIGFFTDATANPKLGAGGFMASGKWFFLQWDEKFMVREKPSIGYLELYAVCVGLFMWSDDKELRNARLLINCDNKSAVDMINSTTSKCGNCMTLIRMLTLLSLKCNLRVFAQHVKGVNNEISDSLSRLEFTRFARLTKEMKMDKTPSSLPNELWPMNKIWNHKMRIERNN